MQAQYVFDVALAAGASEGDIALIVDRQGGIRVLNPSGWSLPGLAAEFGADAIFRVERRAGQIVLEGWHGRQHCLIQQDTELTQFGLHPHATMPQSTALALASENDRSPQVRNSYSLT